MALGRADLLLIRELKQKGYITAGAAVIEIGTQQVDDSIRAATGELEQFGMAFGAMAPPPLLAWDNPEGANRLAGAPMAREIWEWAGFRYASIDVDGSPNSIALDLNYDDAPSDLRGSFSVVTNLGTTEHVANQLNAFKIIHDLTATNGVMLHNVPCSHIQHGLFGYTPGFFWALARSNGYQPIYMDVRFGPALDLPDKATWDIAALVPDFEQRWRASCPCLSSIHVALQKKHDLDFVAPLDIPDAAQTSFDELRRRYWTVFDHAALRRIPYSQEQREEAVQARERAVFQREQEAAKKEQRLSFKEVPFGRLRYYVSQYLPFLGATKRRILRQKRTAIRAVEKAK